jgi:hypothetical protein
LLTVDTSPTITASSAVTRQQGTAASAATLATVSDAVDQPGSVTVTATSVPAGITVGAITNTNGTITANVSASCGATVGANMIRLQAMNTVGFTSTATFIVNVTANSPPALGTYAASEVKVGNSITVNPSAAPSDNGSVVSLTASAPGFSGTISANSTTGAVTISNAGPVGTYKVTVTATDNCGASASTTFTLTVWDCNATIAPAFANVSSAPGSGSVSVNIHSTCSWTASAPTGSFVTITSGSSGSGSGTLTYSVARNNGAAGQSTTLTIAGLAFTVTQSAAGVATFPMTATASATQVAVSWSAVAGATSYQLHRTGGFVAPTGLTSYNDTSVVPRNGYVYQVVAIGSGGVIAYSNADLAVPFNYTNAVVSGGVIRAVDFTELRQAANAALAAVGLPAMSFTGTIAAGSPTQALHLTEIRSAVDQARAAVGLAPLSYTDPTVAAGATIVKAAHVQELRSGLQ